MQENQQILEKIRKLLQVDSVKGATQAEAEQALMAAQRLALKHNIDLASVDASADTSAGEPIVNQPWTPHREGGGECAARYIEQFGSSCWELDAINPAVLAGLVEQAIKSRVDLKLWKEAEKLQEAHKDQLQDITDELS